MGFVVFLDVDGVLNTSKTCQKSPNGYVGIDVPRVNILGRALRKVFGEGVVLTSTWKELKPENDDYKYLMENLNSCNVKMLGSTKDDYVTKRGLGILKYLESHPEIDEFVVLDDMHFDFENYPKIWESFLDTKGKGIENAAAASKTPSIAAILFLDAISK